MAGVQAGRLSIEIVAEVARLQQDLDKAKRVVNAASNDIARSARAANDNLASIGKGAGAGVQQFSRDIAALKAQLDPAWAAQQKFNDSQRLAIAAFNAGAISREQLITHMRAINEANKAAAPAAIAAAAAVEREAQAQREAAQAAEAAAREQALLVAQAERLRAELDPMYGALQRLDAELALYENLLARGVINEREFSEAADLAGQRLLAQEEALRRNVTGMAGVSGSGRMMSMQLSQVVQQSMAGGNALQALAMQLPDIAVGMSAAGASAGKFAAFMGSDFGIALTSAIALLASLAVSHFTASDASDEHKKSAENLTKAIDTLNESVRSETSSQQQNTTARLENAFAMRQQAEDALKLAKAELTRVQVLQNSANEGANRSNNPMAIGLGIASRSMDAARAKELNTEIEKQQQNIDKSNQSIRGLQATIANGVGETYFDAAGDATRRFNNELGKLEGQLRAGQISLTDYTAKAAVLRGQLHARQQEIEAANKKGSNAAATHAAALERDNDAIEAAIRGYYSLADAYKVSDAAAMEAAAKTKAETEAIRKRGDVALYTALELRRAVAEQTASAAKSAADLNAQAKAQETVNASVQAGTLHASNASKALSDMAQQREILAAISAAANNHDAEGMAKAQKALDDLTAAQIRNNKAATAADDIQRTAQLKDDALSIQNEIALTKALGEAQDAARKGFSGDALADQMAAIGVEAEKARIRLEAETQAALLLRDGLTSAAAATIANAEARVKLVDLQAKFDKEAVAAQRLADNVEAISGALGNVGGAAGPLGQLLGVFTSSNPTGALLGMGGIGTLVGLMTGGGQQAYRQQGKIIADNISKVFGIEGPFAKTLGSVLQGAGVGSLVGGTLFGDDKGAQIGSAIGGAFGSTAFKALAPQLFKSLGSLGGPIGTIVGSVLGGVIGGLFKKTTKGSAFITNDGVRTSGNNSQLQSQMSQTGNSINDALAKIASQLGGTIGDYNVAIAQRSSGWIHVDASGAANVGDGNWINKAGSNAIYNGKDMAEAVKVALANAIQDGAVQGINHIQQWLLENNSNIDAALAQASKVGAVFDELRQRTDPLGVALESLDKQFTDLRETFTAAGATAEEMSQLEQLLSLKRKDAMDEDAKRQLDDLNKRRELEVRLLEAQGKSADALALSRQIELSQTDDNLKALMQQIYVAEDARDATGSLKDFAESLTKFRDSLRTDNAGQGITYEAARKAFNTTASLAARGDAAGLAGLEDASKTFLQASMNNASSLLDYQRDVAKVASAVDKGIFAATETADYAQLQLDALNHSQAILASIDSGIAGVQTLLGGNPVNTASTVVPTSPAPDNSMDRVAEVISDQTGALKDEIEALRTDLNAGLLAVAQNTSGATRYLARWDRGDALAIVTDEDRPIQAEVVS